ncbi:class I SAM-dependent methyltransferase [Clostridium sediminicola]|uniref:class I SAM-dependent methyltransferase n=1 Tax=Clostridium sediminicola TaxID=3114879 RepID=UPI0031F2084F
MKFYDQLAKDSIYDVIFPAGEYQCRFLQKYLPQNIRILDVAMGTGNYAVELLKKGYNVEGLEIDKNMFELAKEKINKNGFENSIYNMNMLNISKINKRYGAIYCIGNSIVHLTDIDEIYEFTKDVYNTLGEKGVFIVQTVNYDRILKFDVKNLPTIVRDEYGIKFIRKYSLKENKIIFTGEIISKDNEPSISKVELYPLQSVEFTNCLYKAGFTSVEIFGSFKEDSFNENSMAMVIVAKKQ